MKYLMICFVLFSSMMYLGGDIARISVASDGTQGNGSSFTPSISADGRFTAFCSEADNLVPNDTNTARDIFVYDRQTGLVECVSVASDGTQGDSYSYYPAISGNGRFVAFISLASNLVPGDTNGVIDIFVHDRDNGVTTRVSVASDGTQGNELSEFPTISYDGSYVAFSSSADNLVPGGYSANIFLHHRATQVTSRVSVASDGTAANDYSIYPSLSADGRTVAFRSGASNLVSGDTNGWDDIFVHDTQTGQTSRVSVASDGTQANENNVFASLSADGRYVGFSSIASNLVAGDSNGFEDSFVHDRQTGATTRVSVASDGTQGDFGGYLRSISGDGRYVPFYSFSSNLVAGDTNFTDDIFLHDRQTGETTRLSVSANGDQANDACYSPVISQNGVFVSFYSTADTLVPGDTNGQMDVFLVGTPSQMQPFCLLATNSIYLRSGCEVFSGNVGVTGVGAGPWLQPDYEVALGKSLYFHDGVTIYGDKTRIKSATSVDDVYCNSLDNFGGTVRGSQFPLDLPLPVTLPPVPTPAPGSSDVVLAQGVTQTLAPGAYNDIILDNGATLIFAGGTYHVENVVLGNSCNLLFASAGQLIVNNRFLSGTDPAVGPGSTASITARDIVIYVNGINGTSGTLTDLPKPAVFGVRHRLNANVYVPNSIAD